MSPDAGPRAGEASGDLVPALPADRRPDPATAPAPASATAPREPVLGTAPEPGADLRALLPDPLLRPALADLPGRVWRALTTPWWNEPLDELRRRWQRLLLMGPIGLIVGIAFGVLAGQRWDVSPPMLGVVCGIAGFLLMYLVGQVESWARVSARRGRGGSSALVTVAGDLVGGGLMGWVLSQVLDTHQAGTLATGASVLAAYSFVATRLLWGTLIDDIVRFMTGNAEGARGPDYSRQEALAADGLVDEALELYEAMVEERPHHADPMIHAAWMLRDAGRYDDAIAWYRRALGTPRLDARRADIFCRDVWEIAATRLGDPAISLPDLEAYLERYPGGDEQEWARREVVEGGGRLPPPPEPADAEPPGSADRPRRPAG